MADLDPERTAYVDISRVYDREPGAVTMGVCVIRSPDCGGTLEVIHTSTIHAEHAQKLAEHLIKVEAETSCNMFVFDAPRDYVLAIRHYLSHSFFKARRFYRVTPI